MPNARKWFYGQAYPSVRRERKTLTAYDALERLNNAVGYLQTLPEFTAEAQQTLAAARKRVAQANLKAQRKSQMYGM